MPVHLGIHSNEQGPTKEAAEIQRSILVAQARRTEGWRGRDLKLETGFHFFFHLVTNHLTSLALWRMCWSPQQSRCMGCGWRGGPTSSICFLWDY